MKVLWILGADDPEMKAIERALRNAEQNVTYAICNDGRVNPENAYMADNIFSEEPVITIWVECRSKIVNITTPSMVIDHHREGDPGYDFSYKRYLEGSSLGQVLLALHQTITHDDKILAAIDHCPREAFAGRCLHIVGDVAREYAKLQIASSCDVKKDDVDYLVSSYKKILKSKSTPTITLAGRKVFDLRFLDLGQGHGLPFLCSRQAVLETNGTEAILAHRSASDPSKTRIVTYAGSKVLNEFIQRWAHSQGFYDVYGVVKRSFAGAYTNI